MFCTCIHWTCFGLKRGFIKITSLMSVCSSLSSVPTAMHRLGNSCTCLCGMTRRNNEARDIFFYLFFRWSNLKAVTNYIIRSRHGSLADRGLTERCCVRRPQTVSSLQLVHGCEGTTTKKKKEKGAAATRLSGAAIPLPSTRCRCVWTVQWCPCSISQIIEDGKY